MVKRYFPLLGLSLFLAGCDTFPGPTLTNGYGADVTITITYSNGHVSHGSWSSCQALLIGAQNLQVTGVSIEKDGNVLREFSADQIQTMVQKEDSAQEPSEWIVGPEGINLVTHEASPCRQKNEAQ
jgi:hypothetical protein